MKRVACFFFGHRYALVKQLTPHSRKIGCVRCRQMFGMNDDARAVIPWDHELEAMYAVIGVDTSPPPPTPSKD